MYVYIYIIYIRDIYIYWMIVEDIFNKYNQVWTLFTKCTLADEYEIFFNQNSLIYETIFVIFSLFFSRKTNKYINNMITY